MALPYQPCPGIVQVDMRFVKDGQQIQNTFHVQDNDSPSWNLADIESLLDIFEDTYWPAVKGLLTAGISLYQLVATDLSSLDGLKVSRPISPAQPGTNVGAVGPNNVTMAVKLSPQTRGRGSAGRIFWPDIPEPSVTANTIDSTYAADVVAAVELLRSTIGTLWANTDLCVLSRFEAGVRRATGIGRTVLSVGITDALVDSMKNRLPGHKKQKRPVA